MFSKSNVLLQIFTINDPGLFSKSKIMFLNICTLISCGTLALLTWVKHLKLYQYALNCSYLIANMNLNCLQSSTQYVLNCSYLIANMNTTWL